MPLFSQPPHAEYISLSPRCIQKYFHSTIISAALNIHAKWERPSNRYTHIVEGDKRQKSDVCTGIRSERVLFGENDTCLRLMLVRRAARRNSCTRIICYKTDGSSWRQCMRDDLIGEQCVRLLFEVNWIIVWIPMEGCPRFLLLNAKIIKVWASRHSN